MDEARSERHAEVGSGFIAALGITLADLVGAWLRPPSLPGSTAGALVFLLVGTAVGGLGAALALLARGELRRALARWRVLSPLSGGLDGAALYGLSIYLNNPKAAYGDQRAPLLLAAVAGGIALRAVVVRWPATARAFGVAAIVLAAALLGGLHWHSNDWARLALHLAIAVGAAALSAPLLARRCGRWSTAASLALAVATIAATGPLLEASVVARRELHLGSSHVHTWYALLSVLADRDGDGATSLFGGRDCDPARREVSPDAAEIPGSHVDENCRGGDGRARPSRLVSRAASGAAPRPDVVLLSIDALRWDLAGDLPRTRRALGPHAELSRAVTPAPKTVPALTAVMRGRPCRALRYDLVAGIRGAILTSDAEPTLGHVLARAGYRALTVPTHDYLRAPYGVPLGFEQLDAGGYYARDLRLTTKRFAAPFLEGRTALGIAHAAARETPGPLALWVHLMDGHRGRPSTRSAMAANVRTLDGQLATFLHELAAIRRRRLVVALFADHGQEFGEHGGTSHASSVYAEQVRVPFLLAGQGVPPGRRDAPVSTAALPATLLDLLGLPAPATMVEPSLLPALQGQGPFPRIAVSEMQLSGRSLVGYTGARYRLVADPVHRVDALFDADRDPLERRDVSREHPAALAEMRRLARAWDEGH